MLENFNPCFVLDLTATPKKERNIISYVDAVQLKNEHMVKLPVIVYNRDSPVSYTHLDVYKRQSLLCLSARSWWEMAD